MACTDYVLSKKPKISSKMKLLPKIYQENLNCRTESIGTGISEYGTFSSDSFEKKIIATIEGGFDFIIGHDKQVK